MVSMKFLFLVLIFYFLFRFITRFLLPVMKVSRMASTRMREMQQQMEEMQQKANNPVTPKPRTVDGDYIDYEEIK